MTTITANLGLSHLGDSFQVEAEGTTREEAIQKCLEIARGYIDLYTKVDGKTVELELAERLPTPPEGFRLLVMSRYSHNSGGLTGQRILAVTRAPFHLYNDGRRCCDWEYGSGEGAYPMGTTLITYSSTDSNSDSTYTLPRGSQEYVDGKWVPRRRVRYNY